MINIQIVLLLIKLIYAMLGILIFSNVRKIIGKKWLSLYSKFLKLKDIRKATNKK
jgi:hypothetical protein